MKIPDPELGLMSNISMFAALRQLVTTVRFCEVLGKTDHCCYSEENGAIWLNTCYRHDDIWIGEDPIIEYVGKTYIVQVR